MLICVLVSFVQLDTKSGQIVETVKRILNAWPDNTVESTWRVLAYAHSVYTANSLTGLQFSVDARVPGDHVDGKHLDAFVRGTSQDMRRALIQIENRASFTVHTRRHQPLPFTTLTDAEAAAKGNKGCRRKKMPKKNHGGEACVERGNNPLNVAQNPSLAGGRDLSKEHLSLLVALEKNKKQLAEKRGDAGKLMEELSRKAKLAPDSAGCTKDVKVYPGAGGLTSARALTMLEPSGWLQGVSKAYLSGGDGRCPTVQHQSPQALSCPLVPAPSRPAWFDLTPTNSAKPHLLACELLEVAPKSISVVSMLEELSRLLHKGETPRLVAAFRELVVKTAEVNPAAAKVMQDYSNMIEILLNSTFTGGMLETTQVGTLIKPLPVYCLVHSPPICCLVTYRPTYCLTLSRVAHSTPCVAVMYSAT